VGRCPIPFLPFHFFPPPFRPSLPSAPLVAVVVVVVVVAVVAVVAVVVVVAIVMVVVAVAVVAVVAAVVVVAVAMVGAVGGLPRLSGVSRLSRLSGMRREGIVYCIYIYIYMASSLLSFLQCITLTSANLQVTTRLPLKPFWLRRPRGRRVGGFGVLALYTNINNSIMVCIDLSVGG
jgi:hypothetical protein